MSEQTDSLSPTAYEPDDIRHHVGDVAMDRDLTPMPNDRYTLARARRDLDARQFGVWSLLRAHLFDAGSLPTGIKAMAKIGKIGPISFLRIAPAIARHFDRDELGHWTDHDLIRARGARPVVQAIEEPKVDPALSAVRSASGSRGGIASVKSRGGRLRLVDTGNLASSDLPQGTIDAVAGQADLLPSEAKPEAKTAEFEVSKPENREADASPGQSLSVCLVESESKILKQTDKQTSKPASPAEAIGEAKAAPADQAKPSGDSAAGAVTDRGMIRKMVDVCTIDGHPSLDEHKARNRLATIREWLAKGCSFDGDYLPALLAFAKGKQRVDDPGNRHIKDDTFARRDYNLDALRTAGAGSSASGFSEKVYIDDAANAAALSALFEKRPFLRESRYAPQQDAGGRYREFSRKAWLEAVASTARIRSR